MADMRRHEIHAVENEEKRKPDLKTRIHVHRRWVFLRTVFIVLGIVGAVTGIYLYFTRRSYEDYEVQSEVERADTAATRFAQYGVGLLKYSNDGAFYTDLDNDLIWNQTYEMEHPKVDISDSYVAIGDVNGMELFILNESGQQGKIETTQPIYDFSVASQGTIAVLLRGSGTFHLNMYDASGNELAQGQLFPKNSGYPFALALAPDGKKLALSSVVPSANSVGSIVTFYNFGSVGQNEPDNIVGTSQYEDLVIAEMSFMNNDTLAAFSDREVQIYTGSQKPELKNSLPVEDEIKTVFYNDSYFGLVFNNEDEENTRRVEVYDKRCRNVMTHNVSMDYTEVDLLTDNEVCIYSEYECRLIGLNGVERFSYQFDVPLYKVVHEHFGMYYTFVMEGSTKRVRLV